MSEGFPLQGLIEQLSRLPGIGERSAQRLAFFFLSLPEKDVGEFVQVLVDTRSRIRYCERCFNLSFDPLCSQCVDESREQGKLCVVAAPQDVLAIERTRQYKGRYHVLGGLLSPIDGIHPEALRIQELLGRIAGESVQELILAINPTIEGDATMLYLGSLLKDKGLTITKLAYGLPVGSHLDYADELTLQKALLGRQPLDD